MMGMGATVDELEVGMNRAAEQATPRAKQIFLAALKKMTFDDARHILTGGDTAATEYFRRASSADLTIAFSPVVHRSMEHVGVIQQYDHVINSTPAGSPCRSVRSRQVCGQQDARRPFPYARGRRETHSEGPCSPNHGITERSLRQEITTKVMTIKRS